MNNEIVDRALGGFVEVDASDAPGPSPTVEAVYRAQAAERYVSACDSIRVEAKKFTAEGMEAGKAIQTALAIWTALFGRGMPY